MTKVVTKTETTNTNRARFPIKGVLFYAHIREPDTAGKFPSGKYKAELSVNTETANKLKQLGVEVKNKENQPEKGTFVVMKSLYQPEVVSEEGEILTDIPLIGNGTEATVTVSLYDNKADRGGKKCLGMSRIELTKFIPFDPTTTLDDLLDTLK